MNKGLVLFAAASCSLVTSCSTSKKTVKTKKNNDTTATVTTIQPAVQPAQPMPATAADAAAADVTRLISEVEPLWKNRLAYTSFAGKIKVNYAGPGSSRDFSANIRIKKDSVIWATITFLGIPAARVFVTQDSLYVLNYIQKEVTKLPLSRSAEVLPAPIDFQSLQNLIIGEPLRDGRLANATASDKRWTLTVEDPTYMQNVIYSKADSTINHMEIFTRDTASQASINNGRYEATGSRRIPVARNIRIQNGKDVYTVDLELQNPAFDVAQEYPFSIPKNYTVKGTN